MCWHSFAHKNSNGQLDVGVTGNLDLGENLDCQTKMDASALTLVNKKPVDCTRRATALCRFSKSKIKAKSTAKNSDSKQSQ